ncbi:MAG: energy transducer TonB [Paucibacter sp.]|nr:energy transducer TonB [Roseateles sp.]
MNFAQDKNSSSRLTGIGIVVLIHVIIIWGLYLGLAKKIVEAVKGPVDVKVIEEQVKPPPPPEKVVPPPPDLKAPPPPFVPPPEVVVTAPPPPVVMAAPTTTTPPPAAPIRATPAPAAPAPPAHTGPVTAAMVCTKMGKPEMPAVDFSGEALFKVTATVKAGRVVSMEVKNLRAGVDRKAARLLVNSIQQTLTETYECPGDHVFEQEFQFRQE